MKLRDGVRERLKEKLDLLKTRKGYKKLLSDVMFPSRERKKDCQIAEVYASKLDERIRNIEPLIRSLRSHIDYIGDPDKFVAVYLLIGKTYTTLKSISVLVRQGYAFQIVELARSSIEALQLAMLFLEDWQEDLLQKWFEGEIVRNRSAREVLNASVNDKLRKSTDATIPIKEAMSDIYSIYSSYTHSGYVALFDFIDVFTEDFDFEQHSQFHYNTKYLHLIDNLYVNVLLALNNFYIRSKDEENLAKVEELLAKEGRSFATPEEIEEEFQRYK